MVMSEASAWRDYLEGFHTERAGITEAVLSHSFDGDETPYDWVAAALPPSGTVVDVACGSGPLWAALGSRRWIGTDLSTGELNLARDRGAAPVVLADATAQPLPDECAAAVVCSMALMLVQPLDSALREIRRMLAPGGWLVALLPASRPLTPGDALHYARLFLALRVRGLGYPNDPALNTPGEPLARAGLTLVGEERRRFRYQVNTAETALGYLRSLYLPGVSVSRTEAAGRVVRGWAGKELGIPLRRIVARVLPGYGHST
jgi:SAM-dependent methyltransferase